MSSLYELAKLYGTDKVGNGYISHYDRNFNPIRDRVSSILELGVLSGSSLKMWQDYFPNATVYGVDIDPASKGHEGNRINITTCSQDDEQSLMKIVAQAGSIDIVIDDASHINALTMRSFEALSPFVNYFYVIEDLLCTYKHDMAEFKGVLPGLSLINNLPPGAWVNDRADFDAFINRQICLLDSKLSPWRSINFYNMVCFFERDRLP